MKKVYIIFCLFLYLFPVFISFSPLPNDRILQLFGILLLLATPILRGHIFNNKNIYKIVVLSFFVLILASLAQFRNVLGVDFYLIKESTNVIFYFFSSYFIVFVLKENIEKFGLVSLFDYIVVAFLIQAFISFLFFFNSDLFELYTNFLKAETNQGLLDRTGLLNKRFIGIGSAFFSGVIKYGFALLILTVLPYLPGSFICRNKYTYGFSYLIILIAGIMTGRFFFVAIFVNLIFFILLQNKNPFRGLLKLAKIVLISIPVFLLIYLIAQNFIEGDRLEIIVNFVFEIFINFLENGELGTSSSDATISMYVFPDNINTWLFGDGQILLENGSYYMGSDVGYVRLIFYFGLISTFIYFIIQFLYFRLLKNLTDDRNIKILFSMMFLWILLLNFKGIANGDQFLILFLVCLIYNKKVIRINGR